MIFLRSHNYQTVCAKVIPPSSWRKCTETRAYYDIYAQKWQACPPRPSPLIMPASIVAVVLGRALVTVTLVWLLAGPFATATLVTRLAVGVVVPLHVIEKPFDTRSVQRVLRCEMTLREL